MNHLSKATTNKKKNLQKFNNVWKSQKFSIKTKLKLYQSCSLSIILYRAVLEDDCQCDLTSSLFFTQGPCKEYWVFWLNTISNNNCSVIVVKILCSMETIIMRRWEVDRMCDLWLDMGVFSSFRTLLVSNANVFLFTFKIKFWLKRWD